MKSATPRAPVFGSPIPQAACDRACCATVPPPKRAAARFSPPPAGPSEPVAPLPPRLPTLAERHNARKPRPSARFAGLLLLAASACAADVRAPAAELPSECAELRNWLHIRDEWPLAVEMNWHLTAEQEHATVDAVQAWNDDVGIELFRSPRNVDEPSNGAGTVYIRFGAVEAGRLASTRLYPDSAVITLPWNTALEYEQFSLTIQHELGHTLGLPDDADARYVMNARLMPENTGRASPESLCLLGVQP
jgi:hypothetical protein